MQGTFTMTIDLGNATMSDPSHVAYALERHVVPKLYADHLDGKIRDENGNSVGSFEIKADPSERYIVREEGHMDWSVIDTQTDAMMPDDYAHYDYEEDAQAAADKLNHEIKEA